MDDDEMETEEEMEDEGDSEISEEEHKEGEGMDVEIVVEAEQASEDDEGDDDDEDSDDIDDKVEILDEIAQDQVHYESGGGSDEAREPGYEDRDVGFIDDDAEEDDQGDNIDEEEAMIQEDYEDDKGTCSAAPWGWANETGEAPKMARAHPRGHGGWYPLGPQCQREQAIIATWVAQLREPPTMWIKTHFYSRIRTMNRPPPGQPTIVAKNSWEIGFVPTLTTGRWTAESRLFFNSSTPDRVLRVVNTILVLLVPLAIEKERITKEKQEKGRLEIIQVEEEPNKKEEEERITGEKAGEEERIRKEAEEQEATERGAAETADATEAASESDALDGENGPKVDEALEAPRVEAGPSNPAAPRATLMIRGREMDITRMDIDPGGVLYWQFSQFVEMPRVARANGARHPAEPELKQIKPLRKSVIQLDKAGVATLLRLMLIPQGGSTRLTLHEILLNICKKRQNFAEVVSLLLSILQDSGSEMVAVEHGFVQLSVRESVSG
ncbi:hypothetical protein B9Z19DRAFT_1122608 [Tuber borchii]|uniref:Uncharacterized protein n=1 Tax=Tuber borchii TaxID=42251 RepID=A0A2T7A012_TUBBO|nr:hypothetical protein B9Z19DRAFT_1122608 [Tuber borchii]